MKGDGLEENKNGYIANNDFYIYGKQIIIESLIENKLVLYTWNTVQLIGGIRI